MSLPYPSIVIHYQVSDIEKVYYLAYYTYDYQFYLYDISDYNLVDRKEEAIGLVEKVDLKHADLLHTYIYDA